MTYSEIKCIDESWLDEEIVKLQTTKNNITRISGYEFIILNEKIKLLKEIKQHLTSVTPILEKVFEKGIEFENNNNKDAFNDYDYNKDITFEQFLNTEVK